MDGGYGDGSRNTARRNGRRGIRRNIWRRLQVTQTGESYGTTMICNEAQINISRGTATNVGIVRARTTTGCANAKSLRAGYLGVSIYGFRNGSVCGGIGPRYTSSATSAMTVAGSICSNPSGSQYFRTQMLGFSIDLLRGSTGQQSNTRPTRVAGEGMS
jgi:hypothetical protein